MPTKYVIESDIPVPPLMHKFAEMQDTLVSMKDGQSIMVTDEESKSVYAMAKRCGFRVVIRKLGGGYRIWKFTA